MTCLDNENEGTDTMVTVRNLGLRHPALRVPIETPEVPHAETDEIVSIGTTITRIPVIGNERAINETIRREAADKIPGGVIALHLAIRARGIIGKYLLAIVFNV